MRKPTTAPTAALMPTACQGLLRTYPSVVSMAIRALSCTFFCSSPSVWRALAIVDLARSRAASNCAPPSFSIVFNSSCVSATTFWMSRSIGEGLAWVLMVNFLFCRLLKVDVVSNELHALGVPGDVVRAGDLVYVLRVAGKLDGALVRVDLDVEGADRAVGHELGLHLGRDFGIARALPDGLAAHVGATRGQRHSEKGGCDHVVGRVHDRSFPRERGEGQRCKSRTSRGVRTVGARGFVRRRSPTARSDVRSRGAPTEGASASA